MSENKRFDMDYEETYRDTMYLDDGDVMTDKEVLDKLNQLNDENEELKKENNKWIVDYNGLNTEYEWLKEENEQLKQDVDYWKQVASQYSNELNVFEHCKKYKTECKDIYWRGNE